MKRPSPAVLCILLASAGHLIAYLDAAPAHVVDIVWPWHARFHLLQAILWVAGLDLATAAIAVGPFAKGERWSAWVLAALGVLNHGAYFIAMAAIPAGRPPAMYAHVVLGTLLVLYTVGVVLGIRAMQRGQT